MRYAITAILTSVVISFGFSHDSQAKVLDPAVFSGADCNPASTSSGIRAGTTSASCNENAVSAASATSFTSLKASIGVGDTAAAGHYQASSFFHDSLVANPNQAGLIGQPGTLRMTFNFDGLFSGLDARFFIEATTNMFNPGFNSFSIFRADTEFNVDFRRTNGTLASNITRTSENLNIRRSGTGTRIVEGTATALFDIVFGEELGYGWSLAAIGTEPGQQVEFFNTLTLSEIIALDSLGNNVGFSLLSGSSTDLSGFIGSPPTVSPVPLPAALPLFLSVLFVFGLINWRKR